MTVGQDGAIVPPAPDPGPRPNSFQRIIGVLFSPDATMASIARRPDWVVPLIILMVMALLAGVVIAQHVDFGAAAREAMEQNKNMSQEQMDRGVKMAAGIGKVMTYLSPVLSAIGLLIIAGVLLLAFRLFGGEGDFKQAFSVTCYSSMPGVIKGIVMIIIILVKGGTFPAQTLATLVRSNLGFLVDYKANPIAFALLSSFDIFSIWYLVLMIIGFAYLARVSKVKSAVIIISLWIVVLLFKLIGPAMQSLRANR
ncbi:MAG: hypothetical protein QOK37_4456 [Thermoanaerobaculia bacterium]|jgi:hypothetical protein|nr:hypothetical protein [Thermoanaerobaculia bacterium]